MNPEIDYELERLEELERVLKDLPAGDVRANLSTLIENTRNALMRAQNCLQEGKKPQTFIKRAQTLLDSSQLLLSEQE